MPERSFTINAYVHGGRWQHHRLRDHFGADSDLYVSLSEAIGPWEEGTPIHYVVLDLYAKMAAIESAGHVVQSFTCNGYVTAPGTLTEGPAGTWSSVVLAYATLRKTTSSSFLVNAWKAGGTSFTVDANIRFQGSFAVAAVIV
jgi:hypothetical protein